MLTAGASYLANGEGGRQIVLKRVDEDCMLGKALHPSIVDRLGRVREVAHAGVANLIGVEREIENGTGWLVWEFVEGETLLEWVGKQGRTSRELLVMARELILSVDQLHMQGLVHGALVQGNVIVGRDGGLKLTHVSPLLYTDMNVDVESVVGLLREMAAAGPEGEVLGRVVGGGEVAGGGGGENAGGELRRMAARVAGVLGGGVVKEDSGLRTDEDAGKRVGWMVLQAVAVAAAGVGVAYGIWKAFER